MANAISHDEFLKVLSFHILVEGHGHETSESAQRLITIFIMGAFDQDEYEGSLYYDYYSGEHYYTKEIEQEWLEDRLPWSDTFRDKKYYQNKN